jgi:predicted transcriptional regulator
MSEPARQFEGFYVPHSTQVPDTLFDEIMAELSGAELKVVLYIIRRTFGFKKAQDNISLRQMVEGITTKDGKVLDRGTGLGKASVARAVSSLEARGVIVRNKRKSAERGDEATTYALKLRGAGMGVSQNETPAPQAKVASPVSQNETPPSLILGHPRVSKRDPQGTGLHGTEHTVTVNGGMEAQGARDADRTDLRRLPDLGEDRAATKALADVILEALGDAHSQAFYYLVAAKVPEAVVRRTLSEIRHDGAREPARVFAHRMKAYAAEAIQRAQSAEIRAAMTELGRAKARVPGMPGAGE